MVRQAVRPLSTNGPTSEFVDQRSRTVAFSVSVPVDRVRRVPRVSRSPAHRSSSTMTPVSAGRGSRQKKRVSFGSCPGQRQLQLTMIKKLRASPKFCDLERVYLGLSAGSLVMAVSLCLLQRERDRGADQFEGPLLGGGG